MSRNVYFVSYDDCTPDEPRLGWYVGTQMEFDIPGDAPIGPFDTKAEVMDARDEFERMDQIDLEAQIENNSQFGVGA